jgi:hypothetical protein
MTARDESDCDAPCSGDAKNVYCGSDRPGGCSRYANIYQSSGDCNTATNPPATPPSPTTSQSTKPATTTPYVTGGGDVDKTQAKTTTIGISIVKSVSCSGSESESQGPHQSTSSELEKHYCTKKCDQHNSSWTTDVRPQTTPPMQPCSSCQEPDESTPDPGNDNNNGNNGTAATSMNINSGSPTGRQGGEPPAKTTSPVITNATVGRRALFDMNAILIIMVGVLTIWN